MRRRRVLVIANETVEADILRETLESVAHATEVLVVAPALNTRLRHRTSDEDAARAAAGSRLLASLAALDDAGVRVDGWVGEADPMQAIEDALAVFPADELLVVTDAEERSNWLAHDLVARACARFSRPVLQLVPEPALVPQAA
jgi:hypothetical protein